MTSKSIERLLPLLLACRVNYFKCDNIEIKLSVLGEESLETKEVKTNPKTKPIHNSTGPVVPDPNQFVGNDLMSYDQIRDWSGTPSDNPNAEVALTGDQPLENPLSETH